jgi:hypothetical protein
LRCNRALSFSKVFDGGSGGPVVGLAFIRVIRSQIALPRHAATASGRGRAAFRFSRDTFSVFKAYRE